MKDRLISADRLKAYLYENYIMYDHTIADIDAQPTVDAEPVRHGHWIEQDGYDGDVYYDCSVCGNSWITIDGTPQDNGMNYCPNCGAKMDEEDERR